jgi:hypothetical protein
MRCMNRAVNYLYANPCDSRPRGQTLPTKTTVSTKWPLAGAGWSSSTFKRVPLLDKSLHRASHRDFACTWSF